MVLEIDPIVSDKVADRFKPKNIFIQLNEVNTMPFAVHGVRLEARLVHDKFSPGGTVNIFANWKDITQLKLRLSLESSFPESSGSHKELMELLESHGYFSMNASDRLIVEKILSWRRIKPIAQVIFLSRAVEPTLY